MAKLTLVLKGNNIQVEGATLAKALNEAQKRVGNNTDVLVVHNNGRKVACVSKCKRIVYKWAVPLLHKR